MIDNLLKTYDEQRYRFHHNETVSIVVWKLDALVDRIRELEVKNQILQKQVQELEKALIELVKIEVRLPECTVCWERDQCTDHSHGDNCLAIRFVIDTAKEAAKETK